MIDWRKLKTNRGKQQLREARNLVQEFFSQEAETKKNKNKTKTKLSPNPSRWWFDISIL